MDFDNYLDGTETALCKLGLEKVAFMGAVTALGSRIAAPVSAAVKDRMVAPVSRAIAKHITPTSEAMGRGLNQAASAVENAGVGATRRFLGESGAETAATVLKGAPIESMRQAAGGAVLGGGIQGGLDAAFAEEGQRGDAFLRGAGQGAASGAAYGALGGALGQATKNVRRTNLEQGLVRKGMNPKSDLSQGLVNQQMDRGFFGNLNDIRTGKGPMGRGGSAANLGGQLSQVGTEWIAPMALLPAALGGGLPGMEEPQQPEQPEQPVQKMGEDQSTMFADPILASSLAGSGIGSATVGTGVDLLSHHGYWPKGPGGIAAKRFSTLTGMVPGALAGRYLARQQWPSVETVTPEVEKLKDIDFDKLMRYYHKRDE